MLSTVARSWARYLSPCACFELASLVFCALVMSCAASCSARARFASAVSRFSCASSALCAACASSDCLFASASSACATFSSASAVALAAAAASTPACSSASLVASTPADDVSVDSWNALASARSAFFCAFDEAASRSRDASTAASMSSILRFRSPRLIDVTYLSVRRCPTWLVRRWDISASIMTFSVFTAPATCSAASISAMSATSPSRYVCALACFSS